MFSRLISRTRKRRSHSPRPRSNQIASVSRIEVLEERIVLSYIGSFRVPRNDGTGRVSSAPTKYSYSYGGDVSAADGNQLWLSAHVHNLLVGKLNIPVPVAPSSQYAFNELPIARVSSGARDVTGGLRAPSVQDSDKTMILSDLLPDEDRLRWVMHHYYNVSQTPYKVLGDYNTSTSAASGPYNIVDSQGQHIRDQLSGRYMMDVPSQWASMVGGTMVSGGGGLPGQVDIGAGPSLYAYSPPGAGADALTSKTWATTLLEYPFDDHLPSDQRRSLPGWNRASRPYDAVWVGDMVIVAAKFGIGEVWYGSADGPGDLYDHYNSDKGYHAEHYEMRMLFYRASDLAAVAKGMKNPWDPRPLYNVKMPNLMGADLVSQSNPVSMSYDESTGRLYVVQTRVDRSRSNYDRNPVVHVFDLSANDAAKTWGAQLAGVNSGLVTFPSQQSFATPSTTNEGFKQLSSPSVTTLSSSPPSPTKATSSSQILDSTSNTSGEDVDSFWEKNGDLALSGLKVLS